MTDEQFLQQAKQSLIYSAESGVFTWAVSKQGHKKAGDIAGFKRSDGYVRIKVCQRAVWAHRLAWAWSNGKWPEWQIDHINGDPSDNRLVNLRDVPAAINAQNARKARSRKSGGSLLGAHWCKVWKRWKSSIMTRGVQRHLGWFDSEEQAHAAYVAAKRQLHAGCTI